ncbi:MAG: hypothetical protein KGO22_06440 [Gammaproteobacteria bacterium]|nr:hypothetical protein [Gammaproteobacteria bacterium]
MNHRELGPAYWILDAAQKYAVGRWESEKTRDTFVAAVRETLAFTVERGIELPESAREGARSAMAPNGLQRPAARTREPIRGSPSRAASHGGSAPPVWSHPQASVGESVPCVPRGSRRPAVSSARPGLNAQR